MAKILNFPEHTRIREEAGYWLVRLDSGPLDEEEAAAFHAWLDSSVEHRNTVIELATLWDDMDILSELSDLFPLSQAPPQKQHVTSRLLTAPVLSLAAAAVIVVAVALILVQRYGPGSSIDARPVQQEVLYQTAVGESRQISLPDGSVIRLNTNSLVSVDFSSRQRDLHLLRGEAHFQVAHNASRPFVVHAGGGVVRAVGTAFSVRLKGPDVEVTVTEGRVEIASMIDEEGGAGPVKEPSGKYLTTLDAGQTAEYGEHTIHEVRTIPPEMISRKMSWQQGTLVFKGETLEEVVREISRYTNTRIVISDPAIRDIRIGGYFKTGKVEDLLAVLKDSFSIRAERVNDNLIYLTEDKTVIQADSR